MSIEWLVGILVMVVIGGLVGLLIKQWSAQAGDMKCEVNNKVDKEVCETRHEAQAEVLSEIRRDLRKISDQQTEIKTSIATLVERINVFSEE